MDALLTTVVLVVARSLYLNNSGFSLLFSQYKVLFCVLSIIFLWSVQISDQKSNQFHQNNTALNDFHTKKAKSEAARVALLPNAPWLIVSASLGQKYLGQKMIELWLQSFILTNSNRPPWFVLIFVSRWNGSWLRYSFQVIWRIARCVSKHGVIRKVYESIFLGLASPIVRLIEPGYQYNHW